MNRLTGRLTDREVVLLYRQWSEENYAAGFYQLPKDGTLPLRFLEWLKRVDEPFTPFEQDLIARWRVQA